jgi:threonine dehydratase
VSETTYAHVSKLVEDVVVVSDADAVRGVRQLADRAKVWAEPAAGCLVPAAGELLPRLGPDARLGLIVCGGNVTAEAMAGWERDLTPPTARPDVTRR